MPPQVTIHPAETFDYSFRSLLWKYTFNGTSNDWRYRYSPAGEREQKRMYPLDTNNHLTSQGNPWVYYLLGGRQEQLAVWHGREVWDVAGCGGVASSYGKVFLYPVEYNTFASSHLAVSTKPRPGAPAGMKQFRIPDHLGSVRVELDTQGVGTGIDYEPFGALAATTPFGGQPPRVGYIDKERDLENGLGDYGVRKYDPVLGRFLSVDVLWERYRGLQLYHYSRSNPLSYSDANGLKFDCALDADLEADLQRVIQYACAVDPEGWGKKLRRIADDEEYTVDVKRPFYPGYMLFDNEEPHTGNPTIFWDPNLGFEYTISEGGVQVGQRLSPASNFVDEAVSAYDFGYAKKDYFSGKSFDVQYQSKNERKSIEEAFRFAKLAGEVDTIRGDHVAGKVFKAKDVTSNKKAER